MPKTGLLAPAAGANTAPHLDSPAYESSVKVVLDVCGVRSPNPPAENCAEDRPPARPLSRLGELPPRPAGSTLPSILRPSHNGNLQDAIHYDLPMQENPNQESVGKAASLWEQTTEPTILESTQSTRILTSPNFFMSPEGVAYNQPGPPSPHTFILASGGIPSLPRTNTPMEIIPEADCPSATTAQKSSEVTIVKDGNNGCAKQSGVVAKTQQSNARIQEFIRRLQAASNRSNSSKENPTTPKSPDVFPVNIELASASRSNKRKGSSSPPTHTSAPVDRVKRRRHLLPSLDAKDSPRCPAETQPDSSLTPDVLRSSSSSQNVVQVKRKGSATSSQQAAKTRSPRGQAASVRK
ncbi:hypothetical protein R1flu_022450 [Riccia fluitans]|uniref:Uncharacterized protein n=1 Tax=Riccia fluitans TaxID=41844 RepID=A0ABD1XPW4_9MARC